MTNEHSGERLRKFLNDRGLTAKQAAETLEVSPQTLNNWFNRGLPARAIYQAALKLFVDQHWLTTGRAHSSGRFDPPAKPIPDSNAEMSGLIEVWDDDTPLDDDEVYVPFLKEVELSAGSGRTVVEQSSSRKLRFGKLTLKRQGVQASEAVCVTVCGNSMEPVLPNGSTVGVDQGTTSIVDGKMYALNHGGQLRVKMLYRMPKGGVRLRSYNRDEHPDEEYTEQEMLENELVILGKVFWYSVLV
jgi:phage repressor protein C with HTH and peptisase S24 domain